MASLPRNSRPSLSSNHRIRLKQGGHATDVTCVLSNYHLPLQFLWIVDRFSFRWIIHDDIVPNVVDITENIESR